MDVTAQGMKKTTSSSSTSAADGSDADNSTANINNSNSSGSKDGVHALPQGLTQEELHVPTDEKDVYAYYYINKVNVHFVIILVLFSEDI